MMPGRVQGICSDAYRFDNSTSRVQGRYATNVLSFEKEPGFKHVTPLYVCTLCSLLSPKTICNRIGTGTEIINKAEVAINAKYASKFKTWFYCLYFLASNKLRYRAQQTTLMIMLKDPFY